MDLDKVAERTEKGCSDLYDVLVKMRTEDMCAREHISLCINSLRRVFIFMLVESMDRKTAKDIFKEFTRQCERDLNE